MTSIIQFAQIEADLPHEVLFDNRVFLRGEKLGTGAFGAVYSFWSDDERNKRVAMKIVFDADEEESGAVKQEVEIWRRLSHPNIVGLLDYMTSSLSGLHCFLMEHAAGGDLLDFISRKKGKIPKTLKHTITCQLVDAVAYIHSKGFTHCDIKPENVLFFDKDTVKLCDFGLATQVETDVDGKEEKIFEWSGTALYFSPGKHARQATLSTKDDIWALGYTLLTLSTGRYPWRWPSSSNVDYKLWQGNPRRNRHFKKVIQEKPLFEFLQNMLHPSEEHRWTAEEAKKSEYYRNAPVASRTLSQWAKLIKAKVTGPIVAIKSKMIK
ncbi:hypothetical protein QR680_006389 [Steinernema hermaphroditum]|uniref:Protein kinase domain-containing protein n=1 Tax=Steinernema hermaphroditum TaxID=289476 RepID=A0AA39LX22_9BILA|nr:hypothetical protein QR680_006389 [Steinernema hermaphroditum]